MESVVIAPRTSSAPHDPCKYDGQVPRRDHGHRPVGQDQGCVKFNRPSPARARQAATNLIAFPIPILGDASSWIYACNLA